MKQNAFIIILIALICFELQAQKINTTNAFRNIASDRYFRVNYDNDLFILEDHDYTQGINIELVHPGLQKNPLNYLMVKPTGTTHRFGLSIEHDVFTPTNLVDKEIQLGDRPFAATLAFKSFLIATNAEKKTRTVSMLTMGVLGPAACGRQMQTFIHESIGLPTPTGWVNQLKNDVVLNYALAIEKEVFRYRDLLAIQSNIAGRVGTLNTSADLGLTVALGIVNAPFLSNSEKHFLVYFYANTQASIVGYDATFQGGLLSKNDTYRVPAAAMEQLTGQLQYGLIMQFNGIYLEYGYTIQTRQVSFGNPLRYGGLKIGFRV